MIKVPLLPPLPQPRMSGRSPGPRAGRRRDGQVTTASPPTAVPMFAEVTASAATAARSSGPLRHQLRLRPGRPRLCRDRACTARVRRRSAKTAATGAGGRDPSLPATSGTERRRKQSMAYSLKQEPDASPSRLLRRPPAVRRLRLRPSPCATVLRALNSGGQGRGALNATRLPGGLHLHVPLHRLAGQLSSTPPLKTPRPRSAAAWRAGIPRAAAAGASSMTPTSSSPSAATAAPTTSASRPCPAPWSAATTWSMSATTTRPT